MSNIYELPTSEDPIGDASEWIARIDRGLTEQEKEALQEWVEAKPENQEALVTVAEIWDKMSALSRLKELFPHPHNTEVRSRWVPLTMAATVLLAVFVGFWSTSGLIFNKLNLAPTTSYVIKEDVFETKIGENLIFILPDGSQLSLNTNTRVRFRYTQFERLLMIERGEVHLQVQIDEARPYNVFAGNKIVQAVGTAFNIELSSNQHMELTVTEGKVLVAALDEATRVDVFKGRSGLPPAMPQSSVLVSAGEQLIVNGTIEGTDLIEPQDIQARLAWRDNNLIFRGESLAEAIAEIERYTSVEFVIVGENLKKIRVAGIFKTEDVEGLLNTLRENFGIVPERVGDEKIILTQG
ncbi:MAG: FecR domain-containing protein [Pseudomonadales bacterium]|nr:FecR domain-containing protein [Pseudomonadales bacterium]